MIIPVKFLHIIPFYPLIQFVRMQFLYGKMDLSRWRGLIIWLAKSTIFEPFRLFEAIIMMILPDKKPAPVFILGFYRSGTTYLQELLSANKDHRTLTLFQSVMPEVALCFGWLFQPVFSIITKIFKVQNDFHNIAMKWDFPGEDDVAINAWSSMHDYNKIYQYPSREQIISERYLYFSSRQMRNRWQENHRYLCKKLAYLYPGKQLILKSPPNTGRLALLKELYPGAKFVFISRNPVDTILSSKRLWTLNATFSLEQYTDARAESIILNQYLQFHERFIAQSRNIFCHRIAFHDLITNTKNSLATIYEHLGLKGWIEAEPAIGKIIDLRRKAAIKIYDENSLLDRSCIPKLRSIAAELSRA